MEDMFSFCQGSSAPVEDASSLFLPARGARRIKNAAGCRVYVARPRRRGLREEKRRRCRRTPKVSRYGAYVAWSTVAERNGDTALPGEDPCRTPPGSSFPGTKAASLPPHSKRRRRAALPSRHGFGPLHRPNHAPPGLAKLQLGLLGSSARACSIRVSPKAKGKLGDPRGTAAPANPVLS